jgi:hypothetical protein
MEKVALAFSAVQRGAGAMKETLTQNTEGALAKYAEHPWRYRMISSSTFSTLLQCCKCAPAYLLAYNYRIPGEGFFTIGH